jgi:hypothetical protein
MKGVIEKSQVTGGPVITTNREQMKDCNVQHYLIMQMENCDPLQTNKRNQKNSKARVALCNTQVQLTLQRENI